MKERKKANGPPMVAYILKKFPVLSETFILNELLALEALGLRLHVFSLQRPNDPRFHDDLPKLKALVSYVPEPHEWRKLTSNNRRMAMSRSTRREYRKTLEYVTLRRRPQLWWRFLQAGYVAHEAHRLGVTHLHAQFANRPTTVAQLASRMTGIPYSFTAHATDIFKTGVSRDALAHKTQAARFVVTVSDYNKSFLEDTCRRAGGPGDKIARIYNGIDLERFAPNGIPSASPFRILCVARLVEKKGHSLLIEACRILHEQGHVIDVSLVGKGPLRTPLRDQIRAAGLEKVVHLEGPKTQVEVVEYYHRSHLVVLPAIIGADGNREGLPVSIVEALACGVPVVASALTGIPEVVEHERNGLIVPPGDAAALAASIERVLSDRMFYEVLRAHARGSVLGRFDRERTSRELHDLLTGVAS
ncbi:MAG TPA: glycosyltransferase [Candidatus Eisenbacteria bacterium]|nr:glycosyltransferase [Candidatus Eisenbacteria bacterium]